MIKNTSWESLVWVIIWAAILSFIIFWILNLLINSKDTIHLYENKNIISLLRNNTENVIKKIDTSNVKEGELFYLYKDTFLKEYVIFTWTTNSSYKYIDAYWNKVDDLSNFNWNIYSRVLYIQKDYNTVWKTHKIIKTTINKLKN
jgi:hypothetical protein